MNKPGKPPEPTTAKLFMHGRSQAVRLPKAFRFEGEQVRVRKVGDQVILEPFPPKPFDVEAWRAQLDAILDGDDFLPEGRPEQPDWPDDDPDFDLD